MLTSDIQNIIKLASRQENTPELSGFWERQYTEVLEEKLFLLSESTIETVLNQSEVSPIEGGFLPIGFVDILAHLQKESFDETELQNTIDISVRFLDNLLEGVNLSETIEEDIKRNRNIELVIWNTKKFFKKLNLNENFQQKQLNSIKSMIYRASEFLAEEKGVFANWVNVSQEITGHKYENWIDANGEPVASGKKIADEMDDESIRSKGYTSTPRRNYKLFENDNYTQEDMPKKNIKNRVSNKEVVQENPVVEEDREIVQDKNTNIKIAFVGVDGKGGVLVTQGTNQKSFVTVDYDIDQEPKKLLSQYLNDNFGLNVKYLELACAEFFENDKTMYLAYSSKIESFDGDNLEWVGDNLRDSFDSASQVILDKYLSRNKILGEFKELVSKNPSIIKELRNQGSKKIQKKSNQREPREENIVFREYQIATESFDKIQIKIGTSNSRIRSLEFLLNEEFKNKYATFYSSFMFITSFLNYMLSMDEDITKVIEFLEGNMGMKTSLGLVSKVVYYSLQTLKEEV